MGAPFGGWLASSMCYTRELPTRGWWSSRFNLLSAYFTVRHRQRFVATDYGDPVRKTICGGRGPCAGHQTSAAL
jgi:hypothetical protein